MAATFMSPRAASLPDLQPLSPISLSDDRRTRRRSRSVTTPIQASSSLANKRKFPVERHRATKKTRREALQSSENIQGLTVEEKPVPGKPAGDPLESILDRKSQSPHQNFNCEGSKPKEGKRARAPLNDSEGSGGPSLKHRKLTQKNLKLLQRSIDQEGANAVESNTSSSSPTNTNSRGMPLSERSCPTEISALSATASGSGRAYAATDIRFENALRALNIKFARREVQPDADDVKAILGVMEKGRDSPEPDSGEFYETLTLIENENEAAVLIRLTTLLFPLRDRPSNNEKTKDLLYRFDTSWRGLGSIYPGSLPMPKPDLCVSIRESAFSAEERRLIHSPYIDEAGFYPAFICEVKTALQGVKVADRQNANNAVSALLADLQIQQKLGRQTERKIRLITTSHTTMAQRYIGWFHVLNAAGKPEWCSKLLKEINFEVEEEKGFRTARRVNLNLSERIQHTVLPQLHTDLAELASLEARRPHGAAIQPQGLALDLPTDPPLFDALPTSAPAPSADPLDPTAAPLPPSKRANPEVRPPHGAAIQPQGLALDLPTDPPLFDALPTSAPAPSRDPLDPAADPLPPSKRTKTVS